MVSCVIVNYGRCDVAYSPGAQRISRILGFREMFENRVIFFHSLILSRNKCLLDGKCYSISKFGLELCSALSYPTPLRFWPTDIIPHMTPPTTTSMFYEYDGVDMCAIVKADYSILVVRNKQVSVIYPPIRSGDKTAIRVIPGPDWLLVLMSDYSAYFYRHSGGVARLSKALSPDNCVVVEIGVMPYKGMSLPAVVCRDGMMNTFLIILKRGIVERFEGVISVSSLERCHY